MHGESNVYSRRWFDTFLARIDTARVEREVAFVDRQLPARGRVLDLCCGPGRHAGPLTDLGHDVIGVDLDASVLNDARRLAPRASFACGDMRRIPLKDKSADAVICMWQSFGHFEAPTNERVLAEMTRVARPDGMVILDLYHRHFHAAHEGEREIVREGARIHERRKMTGDRLRVHLDYSPNDFTEEFEWQLYTPAEIAALGARVGLRILGAYTEFDEQMIASAELPRMQIVLIRARKA